ncbi:MAG: hypothetical protein WB992_15500 [Bryobacteraceae bacterium]
MAAFAGALTAAIPVIDKIVKAIFPGSEREKKTKKEAKDAVADEKSASGAALRSVSDELQLIATLLEYCLPAEDGIVSIRAVLEANKAGNLSPADQLTIRKSWRAVKKNLGKISDNETKKAVKGISDVFTKSTFLEVIDADTDSIDQDIGGTGPWALGPLGTEVSKLYDLLNEVNKVAGRVVGGISDELGKLSTAQSKKTGSG